MQLPLLPQLLFLLLWYLVSMSLMSPSTYIQHGVYIFSLVSAIFVFWLGYDLTNRFERPSSIIGVFIAMNILVAAYCAIQLWIGPGERLVLFGIPELNMTRVRADGRLTGPFESAEITAQYLVLMEFLIIHQFWYTTNAWFKRALIFLAAMNLACLVATGSRGEFLLLIGGFVVYLWLFRRRLGVARAIGFAVGGVVTLTATALIVVSFTPFGELFDRLEQTEFSQKAIPDTRQALWPPAWREIVKNPVVGNGPRFRFYQEDRGARYEDHTYIKYPHNLYLFLLFTVGIPGLALFMLILLTIIRRCWRAMARPNGPPYFLDLARTGVIVILLFIIDGLKIDQMRLNLSDYWHFFFGLCGVFMAVCDRIEKQTALEKQKNVQTSEATTRIRVNRSLPKISGRP